MFILGLDVCLGRACVRIVVHFGFGCLSGSVFSGVMAGEKEGLLGSVAVSVEGFLDGIRSAGMYLPTLGAALVLP